VRTLVWFRGKDLRVSDHAPLRDAIAAGEVVPLFVLDPYFFSKERAPELPHRMQFLLESLERLQKNVAHLGSRLVLARGKSTEVVPALAARWKVDRVVAHRWIEPFGRERDRRVAAALRVPFVLYEGELLAPPASVLTGGGTPFAVFTPFSRAFRAQVKVGATIAAPRAIPPLPADVTVDDAALPTLASLGLTTNPRLQAGGERAGRDRLKAFLAGPAASYVSDRDRMDRAGTSRLSADLKFGTVSVRAVWNAAEEGLGGVPDQLAKFHDELLWREFAHGLLWTRPELLKEPFRRDFVGFPWRRAQDDPKAWDAWTAGTTGYPVVDASARQLLAEGYVHNRARMISASFLTKHLLLSFRDGEAHYLKYLTDGDWAQNDAGWQWSAGCGCDAQPYFRVFNPTSQGERFDPDGGYVRTWVPELAKMPAKYIHCPTAAPADVLAAAGVRLGVTYARPVVDHAASRARFLKVAKEHLGRAGA
jgi:deoxyribodipyrimidine photo-lyase